MKQPPGYPKVAFAFVQLYVGVEDGKEVAFRDHDEVLAMTFESHVAERTLALLKEKGAMIRSTIQPMPAALLDMMEQPKTETNDDALNSLLEIADASIRNEE